LACCAGNARSFCDPKVPGAQWKNGAMGNAIWTGVKVKDILEMAGVKSGSQEVTFNGMDKPALPETPDFIKSLQLAHAQNGEVMIAYEMNGQPLPVLNGFPLKLVVPGWYATYWIGMLNENKDSLSKNMTPINKMDVRSIFVSPEPDSILKVGTEYEFNGLAFDGGDGIAKVEISLDKGKSWQITNLQKSLGKYAWRRWTFKWKAVSKGEFKFMVKATTIKGETQPEHHWNRSGYMRNEIESITLKVE
jgi:hypothetical protein